MDLFEEIDSGLESLGLTEVAEGDDDFQERLQVLQERVAEIESTGLISRSQVQQLVSSGVQIDERRYPAASFTLEPSPTNIRPAMEAADVEKKGLIKRLIEMAIAAYERVRNWIVEKVKQLKAFFQTAEGKRKAEEAEKAPLLLTEINSLRYGVGQAILKFNGVANGKGEEGKEAVATVNGLWAEWVERDKAIASRILRNQLLNSPLLSDQELRSDFVACQTSFNIVATSMLSTMTHVNDVLKSIHLGNISANSPEAREALKEKAAELESYLTKSVQHPLTTKLYEKYGDGSVEMPSVQDGFEAIIKHLYSEQPLSEEDAADWGDLTKNLAMIVKTLKPIGWASHLSRNKAFDLDITISQGTSRIFETLGSTPEVQELARKVSEFQGMMGKMFISMFRIESLMAKTINDLSSIVNDRLGSFTSVAYRIANAYKKAGLQKEWEDVALGFYTEMSKLAND